MDVCSETCIKRQHGGYSYVHTTCLLFINMVKFSCQNKINKKRI